MIERVKDSCVGFAKIRWDDYVQFSIENVIKDV